MADNGENTYCEVQSAKTKKLMNLELNRIYNEDCLEGMKHIPDNSVDCIICDLPYGSTACAWDSVIPFDGLWVQYRRVAKMNAPIVLFGSEPFSTKLRMSAFDLYKYDWIWVKNHQALTIIDILFATRMEAGFKVKVEKRMREIRFLVISLT